MQLNDYIKGKRKGKEAHDFELNALDDEFLNDAIEGFDAVDGNHEKNIAALQKQILANAAARRNKRRNKNPYWIWISAACVVMAVMFGSGLLFLKSKKDKNLIAYTKPQQKTETNLDAEQPADSKTIESLSEEENFNNNSIDNNDKIQNSNKKTYNKEVAKKSATTSKISRDKGLAITENLEQEEYSQNANTQAKQSTIVPQTQIYEKEELQKGYAPKEESQYVAESIVINNNESKEMQSVNNSQQPLYVINGNVVDANQAQNIDQSSITSVNVLNDANATNIYGARAANGVVLITTKNKEDYAAQGKTQNNNTINNIAEIEKYIIQNKKTITDNNGNIIHGAVTLEFKVHANGKPRKIKVIKSLCPQADDEAVRLIKNSEKWTPTNNKIQYTINF